MDECNDVRQSKNKWAWYQNLKLVADNSLVQIWLSCKNRAPPQKKISKPYPSHLQIVAPICHFKAQGIKPA